MLSIFVFSCSYSGMKITEMKKTQLYTSLALAREKLIFDGKPCASDPDQTGTEGEGSRLHHQVEKAEYSLLASVTAA